eukprot:TRINITY_DN2339_c0_g1_i3.p1 TRINITY_DN2339_c0_g1~~TRINITY_DN2339_c0_g1_i3.p1  ORF type:complete len:692 (+),score=194.79 TRINITY_DN2339_c0_g1_i3:80-2155(+)
MPTAKNGEVDVICLLMDVGPSSARSGYLEEAKNVAMSLVERKMFSEAKDRFVLVLFGSEETDNGLEYPGVKIVKDLWGPASFDLLRYLELKVGGDSTKGSDWLDAIVVGLDFLKDKAPNANKKLVLLSDLASPFNEDQFEVIVTNMENENAELCFFGPEWDDESEGNSESPQEGPSHGGDHGNGSSTSSPRGKKPLSKIQSSASSMLHQMVERTDGIFCNAEEAMLNLLYKERKSKKPFPWRVVLELGPNIRISTTGFVSVRRESVKTWKKCLACPTDERSYDLKPEVSYVSKEDSQKPVDSNNLIESYKYGSKLITVSEEDKANFNYEGGAKSLKVIGFIKQDQIPHQYLLGNGNMVFLPTENDPHSSTALSAVIQAMIELGRAALVRKVYRAKTTPRLGILVPETLKDEESEEESLRLIFIELPYAEDVRKYTFLPLYSEASRPSEEQLDAMDAYIDAAALEEDDLQTEAMANPCNQYLYRCLTHRALNPGRLLPNVDCFIKKLYTTSEAVAQNTKDTLVAMNKVFPLEEIKDTKNKKRKTNEPGSEDDAAKKSKKTSDEGPVTRISRETPASDFNKLLEQGMSFDEASQNLESTITDLLRGNNEGNDVGILVSCLKAYREACLIKSRPLKYNDFLREFKLAMQRSGVEWSDELWLEVAEKSLGLISKFEHGKSGVLTREADDFLTSLL